MMDQYSLDSLSGVSIRSLRISDHAPVSIALHTLSYDKKSWTWPLNENILDDAVVLRWVSESISRYSVENSTDDVGVASIWEGHKAVIRGELISQGSRLKNSWEGDLQNLLLKI